ncbi:MAG: Hpt domain-containing protein [Methylobacterium sp.]|jgi:chemotaxis protein histidine kinase CheA|nr:Hpt domain-containing protein [Methylobacterium sp.]MCA3604794.1 Hpt domain-containing protein [Methylobacterium sp.]MCA3605996.1 Hpt domain-containing protein [Methylobacterium sp.]MCA3608622.1 Hpt domain-containing protein [Methylobacterium sp.]MCA3616133.1 Hpt domain-containing protein [Methylobacterium sp.]
MTRPNAPESNVPNTIEQDFGGTRLIHLSGTLRAKAAVRNSDASGVDDLSIAAAESAMKDLSGDFQNWMGDEVNRLVAAFDEYRSNGPGKRDISNLFRAAHDIRGQASAFGYPLAAEIAGSLAKLLDKIEPDYLPVQLITHHVDAVRAVYRSQIRDYANPIAVQIIHNLNKAIDRVVEARAKALAEEQKIALGR